MESFETGEIESFELFRDNKARVVNSHYIKGRVVIHRFTKRSKLTQPSFKIKLVMKFETINKNKRFKIFISSVKFVSS